MRLSYDASCSKLLQKKHKSAFIAIHCYSDCQVVTWQLLWVRFMSLKQPAHPCLRWLQKIFQKVIAFGALQLLPMKCLGLPLPIDHTGLWPLLRLFGGIREAKENEYCRFKRGISKTRWWCSIRRKCNINKMKYNSNLSQGVITPMEVNIVENRIFVVIKYL